jgi:hypothetical protein
MSTYQKIVARMQAGRRQRSLQGHPAPRCPYGYRYVWDMARRKLDKGYREEWPFPAWIAGG